MRRLREWLATVDRSAKPVPVLVLAVICGLLGNTIGPFWAKVGLLAVSLALLVYGIAITRRPR